MHPYNIKQIAVAERRRRRVRELRAKIPRPTWKAIGMRMGVSAERARQLGKGNGK